MAEASASAEALNPGVEEKLAVARENKDAADQAFKSGDLQNGMQ